MFSLLFDTSFWYDVLTVVAIIAVIYILIKFPHAKIYVFSILFALITATGIYSIININSYYSASGGIYGILTGNFDENNQLCVNEKNFELKNTTLTQKNGDTYSAKSISDEIFKINTNEYLGVFVNGSPCTYSKIEEDYFVAYYNYNFYGRDNNVLFNDTLKMYFSFYDKSTQLEVMTDGGSESVKYWGYYFNNNDFNVTLKSVKTAYNKELTIGEGDTTNYAVVRYYLDGELYTTQVYEKGTKIKLPTGYEWKNQETGEIVLDDSIINIDLNLYYSSFTIATFSFSDEKFILQDEEITDNFKALINRRVIGTIDKVLISYSPTSGSIACVAYVTEGDQTRIVYGVFDIDKNLSIDKTSIQNYISLSILHSGNYVSSNPSVYYSTSHALTSDGYKYGLNGAYIKCDDDGFLTKIVHGLYFEQSDKQEFDKNIEDALINNFVTKIVKQ